MSAWDFIRDAASVRLLVAYGVARGVSAPTLLRRTGLLPAQLDDPQVEVQASQELMVVAHLLRALGQPPWMGLDVGHRYGFTTYGLWGYGLICSATLGEALQRALRFLPLTYAFCRITAMQRGAQFWLTFDASHLDDPARSFLVQRDLAAACRLVADLSVPGCRPSAIHLRAPAPDAATRRANQALLGAPCTHGADEDAIVLDAAWLAQPLPHANALTATLCEQLCGALVERRRTRHGTAELVRAHLLAAGDAMPDLPQLAQALYTSQRTLKRRLQAEGTSFRLLLADARQQRACELLRDGALPLQAIASRLGFSDQAAFAQAFKRWCGVAPGQWRRQTDQG